MPQPVHTPLILTERRATRSMARVHRLRWISRPSEDILAAVREEDSLSPRTDARLQAPSGVQSGGASGRDPRKGHIVRRRCRFSPEGS